LVLVGLRFLTGSDVKDVESVCASFTGGFFLESPEFMLDLLLLFTGNPVIVLGRRHFLELVAESALCVLSSCRLCPRCRQLGRADPSLQVLRTN